MKLTLLFNKNSRFVPAGSGFVTETGININISNTFNNLEIEKNEKYT